MVQAVTVEIVAAAMLAVRMLAAVAVAMPIMVAVEPVAMSQTMSVATVANEGTGLTSAGRRNMMKRCKLGKQRRMMNPPHSWWAQLSSS
jgi:hypothetical protein